jgi:hypothetical protein
MLAHHSDAVLKEFLELAGRRQNQDLDLMAIRALIEELHGLVFRNVDSRPQ